MRPTFSAACFLASTFGSLALAEPNALNPKTALRPFASRPAQPPALNGSDSCSSADPISGTGTFAFDDSAATTGSEGQTEAACLAFGQTGIDHDVWFSWTATATGTATLSLCGGTGMDSKVAAYPGGGCPVPGSALACNDDFCGLQSQIAFPVSAGSSYTLQLGTFPGAAGSAGTFTLSIASTPANDDCSAATTVAGTGPFPFDNNGATTGSQGQSELFCSYQGATGIDSDVWFTWTASLTGTYAASLCGGTSIDTKLAVYDGAGCPAGASIGCNDDACSLQSEVLFAAQAGASYTFQIGSHPGTGQGSGTWTITFRGVGPANDDPDCSNPLLLPGTTTGYSVDSANATTTKPQTIRPCYDNALSQDVWYKWTAPATDSYTFSLCGSGTSGFTPGINIYHDEPPSCPGSYFTCGDSCGGSEVCFSATAGQNFWVQIGTAVGAQGTNPLSLSITEGPCTTGTPFCDPGVSGTLACPCANPPAGSGRGCNNSSNTGGASLGATGSSSLGADSVVFTTAGEKPTATSVVLQGTSLTSGVLFGQGVRCVAGVLKRLYVKSAVGGSITAPSGSDPTVSARSASLGDPIGAGSHRYYLVYYRDPIVLGGCSPTATFNATNGRDLLWLP
jgi:hypothetical protein